MTRLRINTDPEEMEVDKRMWLELYVPLHQAVCKPTFQNFKV